MRTIPLLLAGLSSLALATRNHPHRKHHRKASPHPIGPASAPLTRRDVMPRIAKKTEPSPPAIPASQVQTLNSGAPLIARDPATGKFKLTMDWKKSTDLSNFLDFPAPAGSAVSISPLGDVEFEFASPDNAAFYRIELK